MLSFVGPMPQALAQTDSVTSALENCLNASHTDMELASAPVPPGLIEGGNVKIAPLPGANGRSYFYEGTGPHVVSCGIAIYGPVTPALQQQIRQLITRYPRWKPNSPDAYKISSVPADKAYWGTGLSGVAMLVRPPSSSAPTLEVEYHSVLVQ